MVWVIGGIVFWLLGAVATLGRANASAYQEDEENLDKFNENNLPKALWYTLDDNDPYAPLWKRIAARGLLILIILITSWGLFAAMWRTKMKRGEIYAFKWSWKKLRQDVLDHPGELSNDVVERLRLRREEEMEKSKRCSDEAYNNDGFTGDSIEW
jgi:hypothetical protein